MSSTKQTPKRFRIERLEERVTPGFLFWADDLSDTMLAQWVIVEGSDSRQQTQHIQHMAARSATPEPALVNETSQSRTPESQPVEFPVWAEVLLQEIAREYDRYSKADSIQKGGADRLDGLSTGMQTAWQPEAVNEQFPAWAQALLTGLDQRPDKEAVEQSAPEHDSNPSANPDDEISMVFRQKCEVGRFPDWAKELLSEVDRRFGQESRNAAAGGCDDHRSTRLKEISSSLRASTREREANVG